MSSNRLALIVNSERGRVNQNCLFLIGYLVNARKRGVYADESGVLRDLITQ